jgi:hypothetical protein
MRRITPVSVLTILLIAAATPVFADDAPQAAERAALGFLAVVVPKWSTEHGCFSCHNNGDAARALYRVVKGKQAVPGEALASTSRFLTQPQQWDRNGPEGPFSDLVLARVQFGAALVEAVDAQQVSDRDALLRAAELIASDQQPDGSWSFEGATVIGSPATYGSAISTWLARRTLLAADTKKYAAAADKAEAWFLGRDIQTVLEAGAALLALEKSDKPAAQAIRQRAIDVIRRGESTTGGWGPYVNSPPEPFDTAIVLLALASHAGDQAAAAMIARGRAYLAAIQEPDGGWPPTTRPPGGESYAQRLSTTGWATLALIATRR